MTETNQVKNLFGYDGAFYLRMFLAHPWLPSGPCCAVPSCLPLSMCHIHFTYLSVDCFWENALISKGLKRATD